MTKTISVLFVLDNLGSGGAQNQSTLLATKLVEKGYKVDFFVYYEQDFFYNRLSDAGIKVHQGFKKSKTGWNVIRNLSQLLKEQNYTIALSFLDTPNFYLVLANRIARTNTKVIISERFITFNKTYSFRFITKKISHALADFATTNSHHERKRLIKRGITKAEKISTIFNGVDTTFYKPSKNKITKVNKFICVASISPYKNGMLLIEAMKLLKEEDKLSLIVDWYGAKVSTIESRRVYILKMENALKEYNLEAYWNWCEPVKNLNEKYREYDALIHTSYREGLPNVVCEALASGLPIIVSEILDHPILADDGKNGMLFDYRSPKSLKKTIIKYQELSSNERADYITNARIFASKQLSYNTFVNRYHDLFLQLIES